MAIKVAVEKGRDKMLAGGEAGPDPACKWQPRRSRAEVSRADLPAGSLGRRADGKGR